MSNAKICDSCGNLFPEGAEDSAVGQVAVVRKGPDGVRRSQNVVQDTCPGCVRKAEKRNYGRAQLTVVPDSEDTRVGVEED